MIEAPTATTVAAPFPGWRDARSRSRRPMKVNVGAVARHWSTNSRASALLLRHCLVLCGSGEQRTPAWQRLEQRLGPDLARRLVVSLTASSRG